MKTRALLPILVFCLFLLNFFCLSPVAYGAGRIDLVVEHGVDKEAEKQVRRAVNTTLEFFQKTYGIGLKNNIRILVNPDKIAYRKDLKRWYQMSEARAGQQARMSSGLHRPGTIIVNLENTKNSYGQFAVLCHELVHHYESQECPQRYNAIRWITEGTADVLAAHILETAGIQGASGYKKRWQSGIARVRAWPKLEKLHTGQQWFAAMAGYGFLAYNTASLAVLTLVEWRGYKQLFAYFQALKTSSPEDAFYQAFGTRLASFEKQFRPI